MNGTLFEDPFGVKNDKSFFICYLLTIAAWDEIDCSQAKFTIITFTLIKWNKCEYWCHVIRSSCDGNNSKHKCFGWDFFSVVFPFFRRVFASDCTILTIYCFNVNTARCDNHLTCVCCSMECGARSSGSSSKSRCSTMSTLIPTASERLCVYYWFWTIANWTTKESNNK